MPALFRTPRDAALRHRVLLCLVLAFALFLPTLSRGFYGDDLWHQALLETRAREGAREGVFDFCLDFWAWRAESLFARPEGYLRQGSPYALAWFADPDLRIHFFRPLTAWTLLVNHRLGGYRPFGYHTVNLALWLLLVAAVLALHRTLLPPAPENRAALLVAGLFFVVDEAHVMNVSWIAARHGLLDVLLAVTGLVLYVGYRRQGGVGRLLLALLALALALLAGESAVTAVLWIAGYEVFLARDPRRRLLLASAPFVALVAAYVVFYAAAGYGTTASSWYLDPFDRPLDYLRAAVTDRAPAYVMGALTVVPAEISHFSPGAPTVAGELLALVLLLALAPYVRERPAMRCAAAAVVGSLVFLAVVLPFNYKLLFPSAGTSLLLGGFVVETTRRLRVARMISSGIGAETMLSIGRAAVPPPGRLKAAALWAAVGVVVLMHGVAAPFLTAASVLGADRATEQPESRERFRQAVDWPAAREATDVYLLNSAGPWTSILLPYRDFLLEHRWVREYVPVSFAGVDYELTRRDARTLTLRSRDGFVPGYFSRAMSVLVRREPRFRRGERFVRPGLAVVVDEVRDGNPTQLTVRLPRDLDDPGVWLLSYDGIRTHRVRAPRVGETAVHRLRKPPVAR